MNKKKLKAFIGAVSTLRDIATDEQALSVQDLYADWKTGVQYKEGQRVVHNGILYRTITNHVSQDDWAPDVAVSLFTRVLIADPNVISAWIQPDSTNPYGEGDKVSHNGKTWVSTVSGNVWEPGVYGWSEVQ